MKDAPVDGSRADETVGPTELLVWNGAVTRVATDTDVLPPKERVRRRTDHPGSRGALGPEARPSDHLTGRATGC